MVAGTLTYETKIDVSNVENDVNESCNKITNNIDKSGKDAEGKLSAVSVAIGNIMSKVITSVANGVSKVISTGMSYNMELEKYNTQLTTLLKSSEKANEALKTIQEDAARTPFDVNGLVQANTLLISAGLSAEEARDDVLYLANAISATGGGNEELSRMAVNLQQIKNTGKAASIDIKQFAFAGIDIYGLLADSMEITREEASKVDVTYEELTKALKKAYQEGGMYAGAMEAQSKTLNGQISTLKDNFKVFAGEALEPVFNILKDKIIPVGNQILTGTIDIGEGITSLVDVVFGTITNIVQKIVDSLPTIVETGIKILLSLVEGITKTIPSLMNSAIQAIISFVDTILDNLDQVIYAALEIIITLAQSIVDALPKLVEKIPQVISSIVVTLLKPEMLAKLIEAGIKLLLSILQGIITTIPKLLIEIALLPKKIFDKLIETIKETNWKQLGKNILDGILEGLTTFGSNIKNAAKKLFTSIKDNIKSFFGIASPSKVMRDEIGKYIPQGIAIGIETDTDEALKSIDKLNDEMYDKLTNAVNIETGKMSNSGITSSVNEIINANSVFSGNLNNVIELDGEVVYRNQQEITARKALQYGGIK